jgi:hypothetical protein
MRVGECGRRTWDPGVDFSDVGYATVRVPVFVIGQCTVDDIVKVRIVTVPSTYKGMQRSRTGGYLPENNVTSVIKVESLLCEIRSCKTTGNVKCIDQEVR